MFWDLPHSGEREFFDTRASASNTMADKENFPSPMKYEDEDATMYETRNMSCENSPLFSRSPLRDLDHNSRDSGYEASSKNSSPKSRILSFGSCSSMEETFLDISELEANSAGLKLPGGFDELIGGTLLDRLVESPKAQRAPTRRAFSMINKPSNRARCLFKENEVAARNFKRPEPPVEGLESPNTKRTRTNSTTITHIQARSIYRSASACGESIKSALHRDSTEPDLVGDFSKPFCLPLIPGKHQDLKSISAETLSRLMRGEFDDRVGSYQVIDCRYPYEYEGGHIAGAKNLYTKQQIVEHLINTKCNRRPGQSDDFKRDVLVFHCEFSSERGPNLSRYLRSVDRSHNTDHYPFLHYPEIYLLDGGYKKFHETHSELCAPEGYLPMLHPDHEHNLRVYRAQSRTFNVDSKSKSSRSSSSLISKRL